MFEQRGAGGDESAAHHERAEDAPEEDAVLQLRRHAEEGEDQHDDEDVVDAERLLDHVPGEELQRRTAAEPEVDERVERERQRDPDGAPGERFAYGDDVHFAMEHAEVEREEREDSEVEENPGPHTELHSSSDGAAQSE